MLPGMSPSSNKSVRALSICNGSELFCFFISGTGLNLYRVLFCLFKLCFMISNCIYLLGKPEDRLYGDENLKELEVSEPRN